MPKPPLKKYPAEIFGYPYTNNSEEVKQIRLRQYCPFLDAECKKPRKSEPHIKIGICSVGYRVSQDREHEPVIICPHRFDLEVIFNAVIENEFPTIADNETILWASEVSIGTAGNIDFVAVEQRSWKLDTRYKRILFVLNYKLLAQQVHLGKQF